MLCNRCSRIPAAALIVLLTTFTFSVGAGSQSQPPSTAKRHFLAFLHPVSPGAMQDPKTPQILQEHFEYLKQQFTADTLVLAGPRLDGVYGIGILETSSREEAQRIMENDPTVRNSIFRLELHEVRLPLLRGQNIPRLVPAQ